MAARTEQLTDEERRFQRLIAAEVRRRAQAAREEQEATRDIARLCVDARAAGVTMARLAEFVQVLDKDDEGEGDLKLRPVTRQAVDQLVAHYENRERRPRPKRKPATSSNGTTSSIRLDAFQ